MDIQIAQRIELVFAREIPTRAEIERLCAAARRELYRSIALPSAVVLFAQHLLEDANVKISCQIGSPNGSMDPDVKRYETELAIDAGAQEIELVPSLAKLIDGDYTAVLREMRDVAEAADERPLKIALRPSRWETGALRELVQLVLDSGAQYLCADRSTTEQVELLRELCGPEFGIIAPAETLEMAAAMIGAGASLVALRAD